MKASEGERNPIISLGRVSRRCRSYAASFFVYHITNHTGEGLGLLLAGSSDPWDRAGFRRRGAGNRIQRTRGPSVGRARARFSGLPLERRAFFFRSICRRIHFVPDVARSSTAAGSRLIDRDYVLLIALFEHWEDIGILGYARHLVRNSLTSEYSMPLLQRELQAKKSRRSRVDLDGRTRFLPLSAKRIALGRRDSCKIAFVSATLWRARLYRKGFRDDIIYNTLEFRCRRRPSGHNGPVET